jgi:hypothetical protein
MRSLVPTDGFSAHFRRFFEVGEFMSVSQLEDSLGELDIYVFCDRHTILVQKDIKHGEELLRSIAKSEQEWDR